MSIFDNPLH